MCLESDYRQLIKHNKELQDKINEIKDKLVEAEWRIETLEGSK